MKPLRDRVFIDQDPMREYIGGILVAASKKMIESQAQLGRQGTVIAVGPKVDQDQLKPGDRVLYGEFDYPKTPDGLIILSDQDICGVLECKTTSDASAGS